VPELAPFTATVISCMASPEALDALVVPGQARACRVATDELLLIAPAETDGAHLAREVTDRVVVGDPDALVLEVTDGWAARTLRGDGAREAFAHLSQLELPAEGFVQGDVAHVHVKILADGERLDLLVPAYWERHLRDRLLHEGPGVREVPA